MTQSAHRRAYIGVACALLAAVGFSAKAILVKLSYLAADVDAVTLLALRMGFAVPFFAFAAWWLQRTHRAQPLARQDWLLVSGLGLIGYYLSSFLDFLGLQYISAGLERLILFLYPTMTVLLAAALHRQAIAPRTWAALALCYAGIALVFLHDAQAGQGRDIALGASLVFLSTLSYSVYLVGAGHAIGRIGAMRFTAYASIVASGACLAQFLALRPLSALDLPMDVYWLALAMALFSTVLPVFLLSWAIRQIGAGNASLIGTIGPVSTIFMAYHILGESISLLQVAGSTLILGGVLVIGSGAKSGKP
jgi:drug/metabolite transporter (DMT)-like permease